MNKSERNGRFWKEKRRTYIILQGIKCENCKTQFTLEDLDLPYNLRKLEIHHIIPLSLGGKHTPDNMIVLCMKCHKKEYFKIKALKNKNKLLDEYIIEGLKAFFKVNL